MWIPFMVWVNMLAWWIIPYLEDALYLHSLHIKKSLYSAAGHLIRNIHREYTTVLNYSQNGLGCFPIFRGGTFIVNGVILMMNIVIRILNCTYALIYLWYTLIFLLTFKPLDLLFMLVECDIPPKPLICEILWLVESCISISCFVCDCFSLCLR